MKWLLFLFFSATVFGELTRLPEEFTVTERFFSFPSTFDIETEQEAFAVAHKKLFSFTTCFELQDLDERPLAFSRAHFFSWITIVDVTDPEGNKMGKIEEEYFRIIPWAEYRLFNAQEEIMAIARMNFWGTCFEIFHPERPEEIYATLSRPFIRFYRDAWTVRIYNYKIFEEKIIDPRLLVLLALYQTDKDDRERLRGEVLDQLRFEHEKEHN